MQNVVLSWSSMQAVQNLPQMEPVYIFLHTGHNTGMDAEANHWYPVIRLLYAQNLICWHPKFKTLDYPNSEYQWTWKIMFLTEKLAPDLLAVSNIVLHAKLLRDWVVSALYNTLQWHSSLKIITAFWQVKTCTLSTHSLAHNTIVYRLLVPLLLAINTLTLASWASLFCTGYLAALVPLLLAINTITL